ncbi:hypothetical protein P9J64_00110 [Deltaproteobacteria bacterium IMCC39524]|nr:hypothetical protein [Deltaproteobacteria bacterium IMCC39524]
MPAKHFIDKEAKLIVTTWEGDAADIEFIEAITKYQKDIQLNPEYIEYNEVANFCKITSIKLTPKGLKTIGRIASKTDQYKFNSKLALVVSSGAAFNLARIYASFRNIQNGTNKEIRIFKSEVEAMGWAQNKT